MIRSPRQRRSTPEEVAYHEAGHAVVGHLLGLDLVDVDVLADEEGGYGHTNFKPPAWFERSGRLDDRQREFAESVVITFLAGTIAEARHAGFENWESAGYDLDAVVRDWLLLLVPQAEVKDRLNELAAAAARLVDEPVNWAAIERLARALRERRRLSGSDALSAAGVAA